MSVYPIEITRVHMPHKGGSKEYFVTEVLNSKGKALVIFRWGKVGGFGDIHTEMHDSFNAATKAVKKKISSKRSGGYEMKEEDHFTCKDEGDVRRVLGRVMSKVGKEAMLHIDPDFEVSGMQPGRAPQYDEDGYKVDNARRIDPRVLEENLRLQREREAEEERLRNESIPNFGLF